MYAATLEAGIFRTLDAGEHWDRVSGPRVEPYAIQQVRQLLVDPVDPDTLYAAMGVYGVRKSVDGGATWQPLRNGLPNEAIGPLAMDPSDHLTLYAGLAWSNAPLYRSVDGGASWSALPALRARACRIAVSPASPQTLWVGTCSDGLMISTDAGATFGPGLGAGEHVMALAAGSTADRAVWSTLDAVFVTVDGGRTRRMISTPGGAIGQIVAVQPLPGPGPARMVAVNFAGQTFTGDDDTATWQAEEHGPVGRITALAPRSDGAVWLAGGLGAFLTTGASAAERSAGLPPRAVSSVVVDPGDDARMFAVVPEEGIFRTLDAGAGWSKLPSPFGAEKLAIDAEAGSLLYLATTWTVLRSRDAGQTWTTLAGLPAEQVVGLVAHPRVPGRVFVVGPSGIHRSDDQGASWTLLPALPDPAPVWGIVCDPVADETVYANANHGLYALDAQEPWRTIYGGELGAPISMALAPDDPQHIHVATLRGMLQTTTGGQWWSGPAGLFAASPLKVWTAGPSGLVLAALSEARGIWMSTDGGWSWAIRNEGIGNMQARDLAVPHASPDRPVLATSTGIFRLRVP